MSDTIRNGKYDVGLCLLVSKQRGFIVGINSQLLTYNHTNYKAFTDARREFNGVMHVNGEVQDNSEVLFVFMRDTPDDFRMRRFLIIDSTNDEQCQFIADIFADKDISRERVLKFTKESKSIDTIMLGLVRKFFSRVVHTDTFGVTFRDKECASLVSSLDVPIDRTVIYTIPAVCTIYGNDEDNTNDDFHNWRVVQIKMYTKEGDE